MDQKIVILCDDNGHPIGEYSEKEKAHTGEGLHHLAITVLLYNSRGEVLLQERKHIRFDKLWDLTGATDLYHLEDHDETFEDATLRCLKREYGIESVKDLKVVGGFNYFAQWGDLCENEWCALVVGNYDGDIFLNPEVVYSYKWTTEKNFIKDIQENPENYTPWAVASFKLLSPK